MRKCKKGSAIYDIWFVCLRKLFEPRKHYVTQSICRLSFVIYRSSLFMLKNVLTHFPALIRLFFPAIPG